MYYGLLSVSALLFSFVFIFSDKYQEKYGSGNKATLIFTAGAHFAGLVALTIINRFRLETTVFTVIVAAVSAIDFILFNICSMRALGRTNLSKYSVFSMTGGMVLPFLAGILVFSEEVTAGKIICLLLMTAALVVSIKKSEIKGGVPYYIGVFFTNGLYGVINKYFTFAPYPKTSAANYSMLTETFTVILAVTLIFTLAKKDEKVRIGYIGIVCMGGYGIMCALGNYILLIALSVLAASLQYPFVTGGVLVISTVYGFFASKKPGKKEIISVVLALCGIAALMIW
ncbi:MAG: hypothetical protein IK097_05720 [Clostridia bacterium]|nr:hypothetical protein [Clostridia bacterium]